MKINSKIKRVLAGIASITAIVFILFIFGKIIETLNNMLGRYTFDIVIGVILLLLLSYFLGDLVVFIYEEWRD